MKTLSMIVLVLNIFLIMFLIFSGDIIKSLFSSQIALISSIFVIGGTYLGYANSVKKRAEVLREATLDNSDELDKIDDKHGLYEDDIVIENPKELLKDEKKRNKLGFFEALKYIPAGYLSLYRVFGYLFLIFGFFFLLDEGFLDISSYLLGFAILPLSALIYLAILKK